MADVPVELHEAAGIEELLDALACEELAAGALPLDRGLVAGVERLVSEGLKLLELVARPLALGIGHVPIFLQTQRISPHLARHPPESPKYARKRVVVRGGP
jgi:hypothetical protein